MSASGDSGDSLRARVLSAIEKKSVPVYVYVVLDGEAIPLPTEASTADAISLDSGPLSDADLSGLLEIRPKELRSRMKPLLEAGWLTQKGYEKLSDEYWLTPTEIVVFLLKYGGWVTKGEERTLNRRIAKLLGTKPGTVRKHVQNILWKIGEEGNRDSIQIHRWAISEGILVIEGRKTVKRLIEYPP
jgi:DNA-binding NarL/FixJ family response regulator